MPMFATYGAKVEQIILFVKIVNHYFERKESSSNAPFPNFRQRFCEKRAPKLCTCQLFIRSIQQATQASLYLT